MITCLLKLPILVVCLTLVAKLILGSTKLLTKLTPALLLALPQLALLTLTNNVAIACSNAILGSSVTSSVYSC